MPNKLVTRGASAVGMRDKDQQLLNVSQKEPPDDKMDDLDDLGLGKKKKKRKEKAPIIEDEKDVDGEKPADAVPADNGDQTWSGSDRDYTYDEVARRGLFIVYNRLVTFGQAKNNSTVSVSSTATTELCSKLRLRFVSVSIY